MRVDISVRPREIRERETETERASLRTCIVDKVWCPRRLANHSPRRRRVLLGFGLKRMRVEERRGEEKSRWKRECSDRWRDAMRCSHQIKREI